MEKVLELSRTEKSKRFTIVAMAIVLFLASSLVLMPNSLLRNDSGLPIFSSASGSPITLLSSKWIGGSAIPGDTNRELNVTILNLYPYLISGVQEELNLTSTPLVNSTGGLLVGAFASSALKSGESGSAVFILGILNNTSTFFPNALYVPLTVSYLNNASQSESTTLSVPVFLFPGRAQLSVSSISTVVQYRGAATVSYLVSNTGKLPALSPVVSLNLGSNFIVSGNQTGSNSGSINAGSSTVYSWLVTSGKGASLGTYPGTISVTYDDPSGAIYSSSFSVALSVVGTIKLVIQGLNIIQNIGNITVKGTIVNYGSASALFTNLIGSLRPSSDPGTPLGIGRSYIGSIGTGHPAFFTLIVPYPAQSSQLSTTLNITLVYENSSSVATQVSNVTTFVLAPNSALAQPPGTSQTLIIGAAIAAIVIIVAVISAVTYRRRQSFR